MKRIIGAVLGMSLALLIVTAGASAATIKWTSKGRVAGGGLNALDCPSAKLCVGVGGNFVAVSTNPTGPASAWKRAFIDRTTDPDGNTSDLTAVGCAGTKGCVTGDDSQNGWYNSTPTSAASWNGFAFPSETYVTVEGIGCSPLGNCTALSVDGREMSTSDITSGKWSFVSLPHTNPDDVDGGAPAQISCPNTTCVIAWDKGGVWVSTDAGTKFTYVAIAHADDVTNVDCVTSSYCIAGAEDGTGAHVWISRNPSAAGSWKPVTRFAQSPPTAVACPKVGFCLAVAGQNTYSSSNPTVSGSWTADTGATFGGEGFALSCPTARECVDADQFGDIFVTTF